LGGLLPYDAQLQTASRKRKKRGKGKKKGGRGEEKMSFFTFTGETQREGGGKEE